MPVSMDVGVSGDDRTLRGLSRLQNDAPDIAEAQASKVAQFFADQIQSQVKSKLNWSGKMAQSVRVAQRRAGGRFASGFSVSVSRPMENGRGDVAAWNENASTGHWVSITPDNYPITEWADEVGLDDSVGAIYVTPTPFMTKSVRRGIKQMTSFVNQGGTVDEFVKAAGFK